MSVDKLSDDSSTEIEQAPFTQICNEVIIHIKDNDAFRIYSFLFSKSRNWKVIKSYAIKICGLSEKKSKQVFSYLNRCGLTECRAIKDQQGKIIKHDLAILNGRKFDKNVSFLNDNSIPMKTTGAATAPVVSTGAASHWVAKDGLLNKDINKNKDKSFCVSREKQKAENQKKHDWAVQKPSGFADTTTRSNSYRPDKPSVSDREAAIKALAEIKSKLPGYKRKQIDSVCNISEHSLDSQVYLGAPSHVGTLVNNLINSNCG